MLSNDVKIVGNWKIINREGKTLLQCAASISASSLDLDRRFCCYFCFNSWPYYNVSFNSVSFDLGLHSCSSFSYCVLSSYFRLYSWSSQNSSSFKSISFKLCFILDLRRASLRAAISISILDLLNASALAALSAAISASALDLAKACNSLSCNFSCNSCSSYSLFTGNSLCLYLSFNSLPF